MSERKVLSKYYPPDFDPSAITRQRGPKQVGPKVQVVRLMAPFSMKCTSCGEYIYRGRKFNARKETPEDEKYLGIQIYRFYIKCTRCSSTITFKTDPANQDYTCEKGAKRNTDPWKRGTGGANGEQGGEEETEEERLDRLEHEEEERNAMVELEAKTVDAKREMAVADALDEIRTRNARIARADRDGDLEALVGAAAEDGEQARLDREDAEAARRAFAFARGQAALEDELVDADKAAAEWGAVVVPGLTPSGGSSSDSGGSAKGGESPPPPGPRAAAAAPPAPVKAFAVSDMPPPPVPSFRRQVKKKTDRAALLGIKKKVA